VLLAFAAGRALDATRFGVAPHDSVTFAGAGVATLIVTAVAVSAGTACARCGT
jgi:hypothetical protein